MVLESGQERLEELGEEVPSLVGKKGSAVLQCPGELLPGIPVAPSSVPDRALERGMSQSLGDAEMPVPGCGLGLGRGGTGLPLLQP